MKLLGDSGLAADHGDGTYLMAWACAESGDAKKSIAFMNSIRHPSASMAAGRTVAQARAYLEANDTENAERVLEDFIRDYPQHPISTKFFSSSTRRMPPRRRRPTMSCGAGPRTTRPLLDALWHSIFLGGTTCVSV